MANEIPNPKTSIGDYVLKLKTTLAEKGMADGVKPVLAALKEHLPPQSKKFDTLILLEGRYNDLMQRKHRNVISAEGLDLELSQLSEALLEFINHLDTNDFEAPKQEAPVKTDARIGEVLYAIPPRMQVDNEVECRVWIAFDLESLKQEIETVSNPELRDVRVSDIMGVELFDHHKNEAFEIVTYDEQVQRIEEGLSTQWTFFVTPLKEGKFPLILKISIVLVDENNERIFKTVVMREVVQISTTEPAEEEVKVVTKEAAQMQFLWIIGAAGAGEGGGQGAAKTAPAQSVPFLKPLVWIAGALLVAAGIWWIGSSLSGTEDPSSTETAAWEAARESGDTAVLKSFLDMYPDSEYQEEAEDLLEFWRDSLSEFSILLHTGRQPPSEDTAGMEEAGAISETVEPEAEIAAEPDTLTGREGPADTTATVEAPESAPAREERTIPTINSLPGAATAPAATRQNRESLETVEYRFADTKPIHPDCIEGGVNEKASCTRTEIINFVIRRLENNLAGLEGASSQMSFIISKAGDVSDIRVLQTESTELSRRVAEILEDLPAFIPGRNRKGEPIDVRYTLPVRVKY